MNDLRPAWRPDRALARRFLIIQNRVVPGKSEKVDQRACLPFKIRNKTYGPWITVPKHYVENAPKDNVTALPSQITRVRARFDKPGRYVWHCHILSHEDHEMMRVLHVTDPRNPHGNGYVAPMH